MQMKNFHTALKKANKTEKPNKNEKTKIVGFKVFSNFFIIYSVSDYPLKILCSR